MQQIRELQEWQPLDDLLAKIPTKSARNHMFPHDMALTCVDAVPEFIAIGTDAGFVFWYNRQTGDMQRLRCESAAAITCLHIVSTVEFMVAAGSECGQLNVFQIRKDPPPELELMMVPKTLVKPIEQYTIGNMHIGRRVSCVRLAKNGMKLFSADAQGIVALTEFDFQLHISKSAEILNETYEIVQMDFRHPRLLVATTFRTIVCERQPDAASSAAWRVLQIGKRDRKQLGPFGAAFLWPADRPQQHRPQCQSPIVCARAGYRFWVAHEDGAVQQTILFRDAVERMNQSTFEVPLLNPGVPHRQLPAQFGTLYMFGTAATKEAEEDAEVLITWHADCLYFLHLGQQKVIGSMRRMRHIRALCVCNNELFVLESGRNLVRIANRPDGWETQKAVAQQRQHQHELEQQQQLGPVEFTPADVIEDKFITDAEECFELPPVECIHLDTPLHVSYEEHDLPVQDQRFLEHSRKVEVFERINDMDYDDSILFKPKSSTKKTRKAQQQANKPKAQTTSEGIVEIGRQAETCDDFLETSKRSEQHSNRRTAMITSKTSISSHETCAPTSTASAAFVSPTQYPAYVLECPFKGSDDTSATNDEVRNENPVKSNLSSSRRAEYEPMSDALNAPNLWNMEIVHLPVEDTNGAAHVAGAKTSETVSLSSETSSFEIVDI